MSDWIDDDYAIQLFSTLRNFKQVSAMPLRLNASCPICGDSQTDTFKARFWYYYYQGTSMVHCYNCDFSSSFSRFLHEHDEDAFKEYQLEKFKESRSENRPVPTAKKVEAPKVSKIVENLPYSDRLDRLPEGHPIIKYVKARMIPEEAFKKLWFTSKWQELCNSVSPGTFTKPAQEHRLVIPIFNKAGKIESFQGRALKESRVKYMTIKADENSTKIYGQESIDESKDYVLIVEGPIDSLFLDNALAITGGSISLDAVPYPDKRIWVLDNEPRHKDTIKRMKSLVDAGEKVLFWDSSRFSSKDINDMVKNEQATKAELMDYILTNYDSGLMATIKLSAFSKVSYD